MGTYGYGVFQDDVAQDVRREYLNLLAGGESDSVAFATILREWRESIRDVDEGPVFWLALAATQWEYGRLHERAKTQALKAIDKQLDQDRWASSRHAKKRKAVLAQLRKKLMSASRRRRTPRRVPVSEPQSVSVESPDGQAQATAWLIDDDPRHPRMQVYILMKVKRSEGGGSIFVASCALDEIKLKWLNTETLQITYPKVAAVEQQYVKSFYCGRTVAVKYRRNR